MKPGISAMPAMITQAAITPTRSASASAQGSASQTHSTAHAAAAPMAISELDAYRQIIAFAR